MEDESRYLFVGKIKRGYGTAFRIIRGNRFRWVAWYSKRAITRDIEPFNQPDPELYMPKRYVDLARIWLHGGSYILVSTQWYLATGTLLRITSDDLNQGNFDFCFTAHSKSSIAAHILRLSRDAGAEYDLEQPVVSQLNKLFAEEEKRMLAVPFSEQVDNHLAAIRKSAESEFNDAKVRYETRMNEVRALENLRDRFKREEGLDKEARTSSTTPSKDA